MVRATRQLWSTLNCSSVHDAYDTRSRREDLHAEDIMLGGEQVGVARFGQAGVHQMRSEETSCDTP
jgi:hypothetical protein